MSSRLSRVIPLNQPKLVDSADKASVYARLDALLDARVSAASALEVLKANGSELEFTRLLDDKQQSFLTLLEQVAARLDAVVNLDAQCDGARISEENLHLISYFRDTVSAFCGMTESLSVARKLPALQQEHGNESWRTLFDAVRGLERLTKKSLTHLLSVGPERLLPR